MAEIYRIGSDDIVDRVSKFSGVNILTNSKGEFTGTIPSSSCNDFKVWNSIVTVNPGEIWTLSFEAKAATAGSKMNSYFYNNSSNIVQASSCRSSIGTTTCGGDGGITWTLTTSYIKYWVTWFFNTGAAATKNCIVGRALSGTNNGTTITVKNPKLEKGTKPTDWTPAPQDLVTVSGTELQFF